MLKEQIKKLMNRQDLTQEECQQMVLSMINGANPEQIAAALTLLHSKGETAEELKGIIQAMQSVMIRIPLNKPALDIVGTGGDAANTVNISTASALVVASLGFNVSKHGNRSVSSKCGSADIIEALKIPIYEAEQVKQAMMKTNFVFLYAPYFHPAMKKIKPIRTALGVRTTFNLMGPLLNPTQATHLIIGVYSKKLLALFADVTQMLGIARALIVHGSQLDEINCLGPVDVVEVTPNKKKYYTLDPKDFGLPYCRLADLQGIDPENNLKRLNEIFNGIDNPLSDTIAFNVGAALHLIDASISIKEGIQRGKKALNDGITKNYIETLRKMNHA